MRKKIFAVIILLLFASTMFATGMNAKFGIELRGGYSMINPAVLNTNLENVFLLGFGIPALVGSTDVTGSKLDAMALGSGSLQYFVTPNVALSLRSDFLYTESHDVIQLSGVDLIDSHVAFNVGYIGVGGRYYIGIDGVKGFFPYIGADLGLLFHYGSFWEIWVNPAYPATNQYSLIDFKDSSFGGNIEVGAQYMFTDNIGVNVGAGYRLASFPVKVSGTSVGAFANPGFSVTEVNLSGLYLSAGLDFCFGGSATAATGRAAVSKGTGAGAKYEQYGDYYYKAKNYAYALKYYGGAVKLERGNAGLYKKIGMCYYYTKDMAKAKLYFNYYLKLNPNDAAMKKWLGM